MFKASKSPYSELTWITTGFYSLDKVLGGGIPSRKITEISGVFSVGKSTLGLQIVAQAQKQDIACLWADSEFSFTPDYAIKLGVDNDSLDLLQERHAESTLDAIEAWAEAHENGLIVLDSIGGLLPRAEAEKGAEGKVIGGQAKLIATFCRKMTPLLAINNIALIVLNHQFVDLMSGRLKTSGGEKLSYAKSIWLMLKAANKRIMKGEDQVGLVIEAEIRKNKLAGTNKQTAELSMLFGEGFSAEQDRLQEMLDSGEVTKTGRSFFYKGEKVASSMADARTWIKSLAD